MFQHLNDSVRISSSRARNREMYIPSVREQFFLEVRWLSEDTVSAFSLQ